MQKWDLQQSTEKLAQLASVLKGAGTRRVLILCHNNPDPDTIASAFGFQFLLHRQFGTRTVLGYGGVVTRAENKAMIQRLRIPLARLAHVNPSQYYGVALVDAQPGTGNNLLNSREAQPFIVIDHHPLRRSAGKAEFHDVRSDYGATSTIITEYIVAAGLTPTRSVANALLYGIKADTQSLVRGATRFDFLAFRHLFPFTNPRVVGAIEKPALSLDYFQDYHRGLVRTALYRDVAVCCLGPIYTESIVPELADLLLRIDGVCWSLCMGEVGDLMIVSLRSSSRSQEAGKVIRRIVGRFGSAGGHREMAGGQVSLAGLAAGERADLARRLVAKFLKIIDRHGAKPKPMVNDCLGGPDFVHEHT